MNFWKWKFLIIFRTLIVYNWKGVLFRKNCKKQSVVSCPIYMKYCYLGFFVVTNMTSSLKSYISFFCFRRRHCFPKWINPVWPWIFRCCDRFFLRWSCLCSIDDHSCGCDNVSGMHKEESWCSGADVSENEFFVLQM